MWAVSAEIGATMKNEVLSLGLIGSRFEGCGLWDGIREEEWRVVL